MTQPSADSVAGAAGAAGAPIATGPRGNLALYRRYRSAAFAEVIGQEHVTEPLSVALRAGRVNHAYLFSGPRGCGKTSSARILARSLNCAQGPTPTPCGVCHSCRELAPNGPGSIDVIEIDAASHNGVDDARDLRERAYYTPARDRYKVYIIDEAHMVTSHAFNALLKVVEEPPDHLVFIFATTEPDKVLQTIRSRTHHYPFRLVAPSVLRGHLERIAAAEGVAVEPAVYPLVVRAGAGSVRDALSLLDQLFAGAAEEGVTYRSAVELLGVTDVALIDDMIDALAVGDAASVYATVDRVIEAGHEPRRFATDLLDRLRDLLILDAVPDAPEKGLLDAPADALERMRDQAARIGTTAAARYAEIVHAALIEMRGTTAPRLLLELVCARMLLPDASSDSAALLQRLERIERRQRLTGGGSAAPVATGAVDPPPPPPPPPPQPDPLGGAAPAWAGSQRAAVPSGSSDVAESEPQPEPDRAEVPAPSGAAAAGTPARPDPGVLAAGIDVTQVRALWPAVLDAVRTTSRRTRALLDSAQVAGIDGNNLRLVMATAPLVKMLGEPRNADVVTAALAELLPGQWTMQVEVGTDVAAAPLLPTVAESKPEPPAAAKPTVAAPGAASPPPAPVGPSSSGPASGPAQPSPPHDPGGWPTIATIPTGPTAEDARPAPAPSTAASDQPSTRSNGSAGPAPSVIRRGARRAARATDATSGAGPEAAEQPDSDRNDSDRNDSDRNDSDRNDSDLNDSDLGDDDSGQAAAPGVPAARQDPETQALDLLRDGLGARPVD